MSVFVSVVLHGLALVFFEPEASNAADSHTLFITLTSSHTPYPQQEQMLTEPPTPVENEYSKDLEAEKVPIAESMPLAPEVTSNQPKTLPFQEIFYKSSELDEQPYPLKPVNPSHPDDGEGITGWVRLLLLVDDSGKLVQASVISSEAPESFHQAALNAFLEIPFSPGKRAGKPVNSRMVIKVTFDKPIH